jgi:Ca-activated chloride channel family protein
MSSNVYIEYVLGASNTMMQPLTEGRTKLDAARWALAQHWRGMGIQPNAGLRAYGHRLSAADGASCRDTELMVPIGQGHLEQMTELLQQISARGMAPLNEALIGASGDFTFSPGRANALILIADSGDSCDAEACTTVKTHREVGIDYPIYVVALAPDEQGHKQLTCIATASQGQYRAAASEEELLLALDAFVRHITASAP